MTNNYKSFSSLNQIRFFFSLKKIEMFKDWRWIFNVGGCIFDHSLDMSSIFLIFCQLQSTTSTHSIWTFWKWIWNVLLCLDFHRILFASNPCFQRWLAKLFSWRKDNQTIYVMCVWSFLIDSMIVFLKNFIAFSFVFEIQFFFSKKVYLFVLYLLLRGPSYVIDIFLDSVWPIDCFWAQFFAMIPTISPTIPIYRNFQWLNAQTNRIPHIFPFHFIIFFCRFVFSRERVFSVLNWFGVVTAIQFQLFVVYAFGFFWTFFRFISNQLGFYFLCFALLIFRSSILNSILKKESRHWSRQ